MQEAQSTLLYTWGYIRMDIEKVKVGEELAAEAAVHKWSSGPTRAWDELHNKKTCTFPENVTCSFISTPLSATHN